ncbi:serine hydrolase domain-containing protein [Paenibacillus sp. FSL W8-0186]
MAEFIAAEISNSMGEFNELNSYVLDIQKQIKCTAAAVFVIQDDRLVNEWYSGRHSESASSRAVDARTQFNVASVRKTYLAFAISLLIEKGLIRRIDDDISSYANVAAEAVKGITIRHCLTHTHGLELQEGELTRSFLPGENWAYNNNGIALLTEMVRDLTGKPLAEFLQKELFAPIGLAETGWRTECHEHLIYNYYQDKNNWVGPNDSPAGEQSNLFVSARELAIWGNLHLNQGKFRGEQVFPQSIFDRITSIQTPAALAPHLPRQGFIWWLQSVTPLNQIGERVPAGSFQVLGITGCTCLVIPKHRAVAVRMYNALSNPEGYDYLQDIRQFGDLVAEALQGS